MSSNLRQAQVQLGRSSFYYEADASQDSIYEDPTQKRQGTHFFAEISGSYEQPIRIPNFTFYNDFLLIYFLPFIQGVAKCFLYF